MTKLIVASVLAGIVAAVAFASATQGPALTRLLLFIVTPLPIFLVGLGIGWRASAIAAAAGGITLTLLGNPAAGAIFTASQMIPGVVLSYLALLNREGVDDNGRPIVEWYPIGRLVLWAGAFGCGVAAISILVLGNDVDGLREAVRGMIDKILTAQLEGMTNGQQLKPEDIDTITNITIALLPALTAISVMGVLLIDLWLAGRIAHAGDQLVRPWPDLASVTLPTITPAVFGASLALSFLPGLPGLLASAVAGVLFLAYLLVGLAIIHHTSRGNGWRPLLLWLLYLALLFANGIAVFIVLLGLLEPFSPIRRDFMTTGPPGPPGAGGTGGPRPPT